MPARPDARAGLEPHPHTHLGLDRGDWKARKIQALQEIPYCTLEGEKGALTAIMKLAASMNLEGPSKYGIFNTSREPSTKFPISH